MTSPTLERLMAEHPCRGTSVPLLLAYQTAIEYAMWAYGVRFTEYDKGFLSSMMISVG